MIRFFVKTHVKDFSSGFRAYKINTLLTLKEHYGENYIQQTGFACMAEILIKLISIGAHIQEIPITLRYDFKKGKSKIKLIPTIFAYINILLRLNNTK